MEHDAISFALLYHRATDRLQPMIGDVKGDVTRGKKKVGLELRPYHKRTNQVKGNLKEGSRVGLVTGTYQEIILWRKSEARGH